MRAIAVLQTTRAQAMVTSAALGIIVLFSSFWSADGAPTLCLFHWLTTLPCPSCGMTRAFIAIGHGHVREAMALNVASPLVYTAAWFVMVMAIFQAATNRPVLKLIWIQTRTVIYPATIAVMAVAWMVNLWGRFAGY